MGKSVRFRAWRRGANQPLDEERWGDHRLEWAHGCSGDHHARFTYQVKVIDDEGEPYVAEFQEPLTMTVIGPCDGSCTDRDRGYFFMDEEEIQAQMSRVPKKKKCA